MTRTWTKTRTMCTGTCRAGSVRATRSPLRSHWMGPPASPRYTPGLCCRCPMATLMSSFRSAQWAPRPCRDAPLGSLENGTEPEDHILPETDSRCMLVFRNQVARNQELNCPIHSSAFYSLLRLGGHLLRLKVKAFLHVRVWGSLTSHNVQSCQGSQSLRSSVGHT
ncbi:Sorting Nexin-29 [Manis pentadactyla]|nr:Sorting Nexin-29 [Manis pentadactyla]